MSISAATTYDSYDTQMFDYPGDIDVPMHSSLDSWFQGEVAMEDDLQHSHDYKIIPTGTTVEVDMDDYAVKSTEYEMADEPQNYPPGNEVIDVEVYDASEAPSPAPIRDVDPVYPPHVQIIAQRHPTLSDPTSHVSTHAQDVPSFAEEISDDTLIDQDRTAVYDTELGEPATESHQVVYAEEITDINTTVGVENDPVPSHPVEQSVSGDIVETAPETVIQPETLEGSTSPYPNQGVDPDVGSEQDPASHLSGGLEAPAAPLGESEAEVAHQQDHSEFVGHDHTPVPPEDVHEVPAHPANDSEETDEAAGVVADPLEISEGVYIDPPPAVLLSLPSDNTKIYLFNPPHQSGASSPSVAGSQPEQAPTFLLQQQPTLYYEPLASVFEALRQEEFLARIPDFTEGELTFDAYDLQLVVSEDNSYAREVTLHDLNVLHDSFGLSGPLRLQLQTIMPRFIQRYHFLRDQIARPNEAAEAGESRQQDQEEHDASVNQPPPEHTQVEEPHVLLEDEAQETQETPEPREEAENEEVTGEISQTPTQVELPETREGSTQPSNDRGQPASDSPSLEYGPEAGDTPTGEVQAGTDLYVAAEADGEEVEYAEPPADNSEQSTEALPADEGEYVTSYIEDESGAPEHLEGPLISDSDPANEPYRDDEYDEDQERYYDDPVVQPSEETFDQRESLDDDLTEVPLGHPDLDDQNDEDELHVTAAPPSRHQTEPADLSLAPSSSVQPADDDGDPRYYEEDWDDDLAGEGDLDPSWDVEHETESNESSITLSSKASSKRTYDEVEEAVVHEPLPHSPEPKRPRVQ